MMKLRSQTILAVLVGLSLGASAFFGAPNNAQAQEAKPAAKTAPVKVWAFGQTYKVRASGVKKAELTFDKDFKKITLKGMFKGLEFTCTGATPKTRSKAAAGDHVNQRDAKSVRREFSRTKTKLTCTGKNVSGTGSLTFTKRRIKKQMISTDVIFTGLGASLKMKFGRKSKVIRIKGNVQATKPASPPVKR